MLGLELEMGNTNLFLFVKYKTRRLLKKHQITHTDFEHECTLCEKAFRKKGSLRIHMEVCGKAFRQNYELSMWHWKLLFITEEVAPIKSFFHRDIDASIQARNLYYL